MDKTQPIYHLVTHSYYHVQPDNQPYQPETFAQDGFIHCTAGVEMLVEIANTYYSTLSEPLLVLEIDPQQLTAPLKCEPPIHPTHQTPTKDEPASDMLFPHIYGPLNPEAIIASFSLSRGVDNQWYIPA